MLGGYTRLFASALIGATIFGYGLCSKADYNKFIDSNARIFPGIVKIEPLTDARMQLDNARLELSRDSYYKLRVLNVSNMLQKVKDDFEEAKVDDDKKTGYFNNSLYFIQARISKADPSNYAKVFTNESGSLEGMAQTIDHTLEEYKKETPQGILDEKESRKKEYEIPMGVGIALIGFGVISAMCKRPITSDGDLETMI